MHRLFTVEADIVTIERIQTFSFKNNREESCVVPDKMTCPTAKILFVFSGDTLYGSFVSGPVIMAKDPLAESGLYFDEVSGLQILDPDVRQKSLELKEECKIFIDGK